MEELSNSQIEELRADLTALGEDIDRLLDIMKEGIQPVDLDEPIGRLTRMDALQTQSLARSNRSGLQVKRGQVKSALSSIQEGTYGLCRRCEEPVGFRRLKVRPETPFCVNCQEELEEGS